MKKDVIISIIAIVALAGMAGYYLATKQQSPASQKETEPAVTVGGQVETSDWKVYRNDKYGFEVKYPKNWKQINITESIAGFLPMEVPISSEYNGDVRIIIRNNQKKLTIAEFYNGAEGPNLYITAKGGIEIINVNGIESMKFNNILGFINTTVIVIPRGDKFIEIESSNKFPDIYNNMLKTFKLNI